MLFIYSFKIFFSLFFYPIVYNQSKASTFNKSKCILYKYYPRFSKIDRVDEHSNQFLMLLYDCMPRLSQILSFEKLFKNANV